MSQPGSRSSASPLASPIRLRLALLVGALVLGGVTVWQLQRMARSWSGNPEPNPPTAQPPGSPEKDDDASAALFQSDESRREMVAVIAGAVALNSAGGPTTLGELAYLRTDAASLFWVLEPAEEVPPLRADLFKAIRDHRPLGGWERNSGEAQAYTDALIKASRTSPHLFTKQARRDLSYVHLFDEPWRYRGEVVQIRGKLRLLQRWEVPAMARQAGVPEFYMAWIADEDYTKNWWAVLLTELPPGVEPTGKVDHEVTFSGYFFKRYRYTALDQSKPNEFREAPLLIGRTLTLRQPPISAFDTDWARELFPWLLGMVLATIGGGGLLIWWYRREDRMVQERLALAAAPPVFVEFGPEPGPPVAMPVGTSAPKVQQPVVGGETRPHTYGHGHNKARAVHRALGQGGIDSS